MKWPSLRVEQLPSDYICSVTAFIPATSHILVLAIFSGCQRDTLVDLASFFIKATIKIPD